MMKFLHYKSGVRVISRKSEHNWPPYSPDLNPFDFRFWGQAMVHAVRTQPTTLKKLRREVRNFDP